MKKKFNLTELGCAHCASKMETQIKKLSGVNEASINFIAQKLILDVEDDKLDSVLKDAQKIISKIEPDCKIVVK